MNERIRQLLNEATSGSESDLSDRRTVTSIEMERFAGLIIRKCADIALREDHDPYECILSHFGIVDIKPSMRYTVTLEEDPETGDLMMPLPEEALQELGWDTGDTLVWNVDDVTGQITLTKKHD